VAGAKLLTSELTHIFTEHLNDAFKKAVITHTVLILQNEAFVKSGKVMQAYVDLDLIELMEKNNISKLTEYLKLGYKHYASVVDRLIQRKIIADLESQWNLFHPLLETSISSAAEKAIVVDSGRTYVFIACLRDLLPVYFVEKMSSLEI
ncbi:unnamed protein product, partial [Didymodactylos carnosus]